METYETFLYEKYKHKIPQKIMELSRVGKEIIIPIFLRRYQEMNWFGTTIGSPGAGKSTLFLRLFELLQVDPKTNEPNFDPETQVVFSGKDFMDRVRHTDPITNPGYCILFDEIEIEANSRGWDSTAKKIGLTVSTMRSRMNIVGASLPLESQLLKHVRSMRDARIKCKYVNRFKKTIHAKYEKLDYNQTMDTNQHKRADAKGEFIRFYKDGVKYRISSVDFKMPSIKLIRAYKKIKRKYLDAFYDKQIDIMNKEDSKFGNGISFDDVCAYLDKYKDSFGIGNKINPVLLQNELGINLTRAKEYIKAYNTRNEINKLKKGNYVP